MHLKRLEAVNFKNFEKTSFAPEPGVNLFVGSNGSGKTSILEAVNVALGCYFSSEPQRYHRQISTKEIRLVDGRYAGDAVISGTFKLDKEINFSRTISVNTLNNDSKGSRDLANLGKSIFSSFDGGSPRFAAVPVIAYYSTQRLFVQSSKSSEQNYDPNRGQRNGYLNCLKEKSNKNVLDEWLFNATLRRANKQASGITDPDYTLESVDFVIKELLASFLQLDQDKIRLYPDPDFANDIFIKYDEGKALPLSYYSDGFRNIIYLVVDLVWRASQLNPSFDYNKLKAQTWGFVTIDEIDLHLHPKWQGLIISFLRELFPQVQFFVTTHSPVVVANFEGGTLFTLVDGNVTRNLEPYFGKQVNDILRNVLGAVDRHIPTQVKLNKVLNAIEDHDDEVYQSMIIELKKQLGPQDNDVLSAESYYRYTKHLNVEQE